MTYVSGVLLSLLSTVYPVLIPVVLSIAVFENTAGYPALVGKAKQELKAYEMAASVVPPGTGGTPADLKTKEPPPQLFSLADLSTAQADFAALTLHIEANRTYYLNQIWMAEDPNERFERLRQCGISAYVENRLIGFVGARAIFPLRLSALDPKVRSVLERKFTAFQPSGDDTVGTGDSAVTVGPVADQVQTFSVPTPAVYMDGALGRCELLEPYMLERRTIDLQSRRAAADRAQAVALQQAEEVKRLQARLAHDPPILESPFSVPLLADAADDETSGIDTGLP